MEDDHVIIDVDQQVLNRWQELVDIMAEIVGVPAGLIMRIVNEDIEVFVSSQSDGNPYKPGDKEHFLGSGLYCETVIKSNDKLHIPNALEDDDWKENPDVKLDMISYLGFPILLPDNEPFGTICVLDNKTNQYSQTYEKLMLGFRDIIQSELELMYTNALLGEKNKSISEIASELQTLRGIVSICSFCKKIRDDHGNWVNVEAYVEQRSEAKFSHDFCPQCVEEHYGDYLRKGGS